MTTIALYSNKGGVGKTTTTVNLAYLAARSGLKTLVCDLDPQSSATYYFRVKPKLKAKARGFGRRKSVARSIKGSDFDNLDLLPADFAHRKLDAVFLKSKQRKHRLWAILKPLKAEYQLILIDCPPTINIIAENVFNASDALLVPLIPTTLSLRTYGQLLKFLDQIKFDRGNVYAFFSMVDRRKKLHQDLMAEAADTFPGILQSAIPDLAIIEKMGIQRQPVPAYASGSAASDAYSALWEEVRLQIGLQASA